MKFLCITQQTNWHLASFVQRRLDGSVNFTQPWEAYRNGFGQHGGTTELWFGNEHVYRMSLHQPLRMRMELTSFDFDTTFIEFDNFSLASEQKKYKLKVCFSAFSRSVCLLVWFDVHNVLIGWCFGFKALYLCSFIISIRCTERLVKQSMQAPLPT